MDEFEISTALLTPASNLVNGDPGAKFEINFARAGNDTIYVFDPGSSNNQKENIDFLFGDIFDNSPEEFEILRKIWTNKSQINLKSFNKEAAWQKVKTATIKKKAKVSRLIRYRIAVAASIALLISTGIWFLVSFSTALESMYVQSINNISCS